MSYIDKYRDKFRVLLAGDLRRTKRQMSRDAESAIDVLNRSAALHAEKVSRAGRDLSNRLKSKAAKEAARALPKATPRRRLDLFAVCALAVLAALALGAAYAALHYGLFGSVWQLALWALLVVAFVTVGLPGQVERQTEVAHSKYATREDIDRYDIETDPAKPYTDQGIYLGTFEDPERKWSAAELRYKGGLHLLCFGPPGSGKSMSLVVPNLAHLKRSLIVIDPKGELAAITAKKRAALGKVIVLNPFGLLAGDLPHLKSEGWNPLLQLDPAGADFEGDARTIADALIEKSGDSHNKFFDASAENIFTALVMWERFTKGDEASLVNIRADLSQPAVLKEALRKMSECKIQAISDVGARAYGRLTDTNSKTTSVEDVIDTVLSNLGFLSNQLVGLDMERGGAIDFGAMHREVTTVYLILPLKDLTKQAKWLRLFVNLALAKLYETSPLGRATLPPVMLILDEFGNLGRLSQIITAMTTARGLRIQLWMFLQNLAQLKTGYKDEWTNFFTGCGASTTFKTGAWDTETAQHLAKAFGNKQMLVASKSPTGGSVKPEALPLIRGEDIARLEPNTTISVIEPCPWPVKAKSPIYVDTRFKEGLDPNPYHQK